MLTSGSVSKRSLSSKAIPGIIKSGREENRKREWEASCSAQYQFSISDPECLNSTAGTQSIKKLQSKITYDQRPKPSEGQKTVDEEVK